MIPAQLATSLPVLSDFPVREIKGLSLTQPWATLVALGKKRVETRSWPTSYRGWVAIHASTKYPREARDLAETEVFQEGLGGAVIQLGGIVGLAFLEANCRTEKLKKYFDTCPTRQNQLEQMYGCYSPGRWGFCFTRVVPVEFIKCKGALKFFDLPSEVEELCKSRLIEKLSELNPNELES